MNKRPIAVTAIAWLLIVSGVLGFSVHLRQLALGRSFHLEDLLILTVALLLLPAGGFILLGHNWARWLALLWMAAHVAISFFDSMAKVAVHFVLFLLIAYSLFNHDAKAYFQHADEKGG
ncbi:MAG: hypothetical protein JO159_12720 [Acidobacteria bacterium]|nr:hypothetical protein [Acidobacteriota bacterium]